MATQSDSSVAARLAPIASRSLILSAVIDPAATGNGLFGMGAIPHPDSHMPSAARRCGTSRLLNSTESPADRCDHSGQLKPASSGKSSK